VKSSSLGGSAASAVGRKSSEFADPETVRVAARARDQARGRGQWPSREPVRRRRRSRVSGSDDYAERISSRSIRLSTPYLASRFETWNLAVREEIDSRLAISLFERFSSRRSSTSFSRRLKLAPGDRNAFRPVRNVFSMKRESEIRGTQKPPAARVRRACIS